MANLFRCGSDINPNNAQVAMGVMPATTDMTNWTEVECGFVPDAVFVWYYSSANKAFLVRYDLGEEGVTDSTHIGIYKSASTTASVYNNKTSVIIYKAENGFKFNPTSTSSLLYNKTVEYIAVKYPTE